LLRSWGRAPTFALFCAIFLGFAAKAEEPVRACDSATLGSFDVGAVVDARTIRLADGREILLAGIEVPADDTATKSLLETLLADGKVTLRSADNGSDRYGRLSAQLFVPYDSGEWWVQADLVGAGRAQVGLAVGGRPAETACVKALLEAEAPARRAKLGLWADSAYGIMASDDLPGLLSRRGRFAVVEGKVWSVRESGGVIYVNTGRVWSRNLTVTISRRNRSTFESAGMDLKKLQGARIQVRGFVEARSGPQIEAVRPEQIEITARD
jgi:endonuclease YncB( thermonuclease family)